MAASRHDGGGKRLLGYLGLGTFAAFLAFYNLADYPTTWFDEGSHLHVPQTLVRFGTYADRSSDGFRYYGPTLGVGPTVMLPIAAAFELFGIGLLQARVVMALYFLAALYVFYRLARMLDGPLFAGAALALLVSSRSVAIVETGRQVLGEVPGLLFLLGGIAIWFSAWEGSWRRLTLAGVLLGAAAITKYQNLLVLVPTIALAGAANALYYRTARLRVFLWPGFILVAVFGLWQATLVLYLGPHTSTENLAALREATAGAAAVFSADAMKRASRQLLSFNTYGGSLVLAVVYGVFCSLARSRKSQQWGILLSFVAINLSWYIVASVGWARYAFAGLAVASLFVARFFLDLLNGLSRPRLSNGGSQVASDGLKIRGLQAALAVWVALIILPSLARTILPILRPPQNAPAAMAAYLNREISTTAPIETWEPELGALTTHNYHYPPARLLNVAVRHIWLGEPAPRFQYHALEVDRPPYVVVGAFARWVDLYPTDVLEKEYSLVMSIGAYELYRRADTRVASTVGDP
jgi:hypothetical protein